MKKFAAIVTAFTILCAGYTVKTQEIKPSLSFESNDNSASAQTTKLWVAADSAVLMDAETGKVLYSKNMNTAYPPASTTKIMTALLALENCKVDDVVTIGKKPPNTEGNNICLIEGEQFTVRDLMYALILESANDCANALAEHISGSVENFAVKMNERAKELGCKSTNFLNPNGLYHKFHKSSAKDMALIMRELIKHDEFTAIATAKSYSIPSTNKTVRERSIPNRNKLLIKNSGVYYEDCIGAKTGYTIQSKHSYVAAAARGDRKLIVALIHDKEKKFYQDAIKLFNIGFKKLEAPAMGEVLEQ